MSKFKRTTQDLPFYKNPKVLTISIGIFIIFVMVSSVLTYSLFSSPGNFEEELDYNGLYFYKNNGVWYLNQDGVLFNFLYSPKELEQDFSSITLNYGPVKNYIAVDPNQINENEQEVLILKSILDALQPQVEKSCIKSSSNCGKLKKVDCKNDNKVFYINRSVSDTIITKDNCYILNIPGANSRVLTYLTYKVLGIM